MLAYTQPYVCPHFAIYFSPPTSSVLRNATQLSEHSPSLIYFIPSHLLLFTDEAHLYSFELFFFFIFTLDLMHTLPIAFDLHLSQPIDFLNSWYAS